MSASIRERIYERREPLEKLLELLEQGIENLSEDKLRLVEGLLREVLPDLPDLTRTGVEKKRLYEILKSVLEDFRRSRELNA